MEMLIRASASVDVPPVILLVKLATASPMRLAVCALSACKILVGVVAYSDRKFSSTHLVTSVTIVFMSCPISADDKPLRDT